MDSLEAINARHAVREYLDRPISPTLVTQLEEAITQTNAEGGVHLQLNLDESGAFTNLFARYGDFTKVKNYIAVVAKKHEEGEEAAGYYGQKIVVLAQQLGLNTCWVGGTYSKRRAVAKVGLAEKLHAVIPIGYGETQGRARKTKPVEDLCLVKDGEMPSWFEAAMKAVQLAPTAMNQQRFFFILDNGIVTPRVYNGFYTHIDYGIAKLHFEIGAEAAGATEDDWTWSQKKV